ncbi:MAG: F0F1 ATP synthase subunit B [Ruminococcaceae bacterium]|nr:F0F1 ATP synthase subunit B [Oscillospiraceae bacterium]
MPEYQPFVTIDVWTMVFAWGNLIILFLFLKKILFVPLKNIIDQRQKQIKDMYDEAQSDKEAAASMRVEYEQKLAEASAQGDEIIRSAVARAHKQEEDIIREANETAAKNLRRADEQIEMEKKKALNQIKDEVSSMAVDIASAVIEKNLTAEDNREIIDRFIGQLGDEK